MARTTFQGPVRSLGGIYQQGPASVVEITTSTTLSPEAHGGRIISVGGSLAAALTLTLPAINVSTNPTTSGPGQDPSTANNEGVVYTIWVPTTISTLVVLSLSSNSLILSNFSCTIYPITAIKTVKPPVHNSITFSISIFLDSQPSLLVCRSRLSLVRASLTS